MSKFAVNLNGQSVEVSLDWTPRDGNRLAVEVAGERIPVTLPDANGVWNELEWVIVDGRPLEVEFDICLDWIRTNGDIYPLEIRDLEAVDRWPCAGDDQVKAPIPGLITAVLVKEGQQVKTGQPLLVLEAMKMENEIRAPISGVVERIEVSPGQSVAKQELLVKIAE